MYANIEQLYKKYPWKTAKKFVPLAMKHGFKEKDAKEFLKKVVRDKRIKVKPVYLPIYSESGGSYQFDTFIQKKGLNFLIFININTRKAYAYPMRTKGTDDVINAMTKFFTDVKEEAKASGIRTNPVKVLRSDQDAAYLSNKTLDFLREKGVRYLTTEDENHNVLGIINRFMRTVRDLANKVQSTKGEAHKVISAEEMKELVNTYNTTIHTSTNVPPNEMTKELEKEYITKKRIETQNKTRAYDFKPGDRVRIVIEPKALTKKRSNLTSESFIVDSRSGNMFLIRAKDHSVDYYPGYKLVLCSKSIPLAETLKDEKRGVIQTIEGYDDKRDKYKVVYEGGVHDTIPAKNLREGDPLKLSPIERSYWVKKELPSKIK